MNNLKKHLPQAAVIFLSVIGLIFISLTVRNILPSQKEEWKVLDTLLTQKENIIDGARDGNRIYALISREGRSDYADLLAVFEQSDSQYADKPVDQPTDKYADKAADKPTDKPADKPTDKPADKPVDKSADDPADMSADKIPDKPADRPANQPWERVYENDFYDLKPWKIELADIDGDSVKEVVTAVRKTTHFDPEEKNRLFIFKYENKKLSKKWTGSLTTGIWDDFVVGDLLPIAGNELIFTVQGEGQEEFISIYYWFDFGFRELADSLSYKNIGKVTITGENRIQISYDKGRTADLTVNDGKIVETVPAQ